MRLIADVFRAVLMELDKWESPTFSIKDFNHFYNRAQEELRLTLLPKGEVDAETHSLLAFLRTSQMLEASEGFAVVEDMFIQVVYINGIIAEYLPPHREDYIQKNIYLRPRADKPYYQLQDNGVLGIGPAAIETIRVKGILPVPEVFLSKDPELQVHPVSPLGFTRECVKLCVKLFLENIESQRYQTSLNEEFIRKQN